VASSRKRSGGEADPKGQGRELYVGGPRRPRPTILVRESGFFNALRRHLRPTDDAKGGLLFWRRYP